MTKCHLTQLNNLLLHTGSNPSQEPWHSPDGIWHSMIPLPSILKPGLHRSWHWPVSPHCSLSSTLASRGWYAGHRTTVMNVVGFKTSQYYIIINQSTVISILKEFYAIFSSSHLNRFLSRINCVPITNLFPKYHMSKHYRTCVKWDTKKPIRK